MADRRERFSDLAPLPVDEKFRLSILAVKFFSPLEYSTGCEVIGKAKSPRGIAPFDAMDFLTYLDKIGYFKDDPHRHMHQIVTLLKQLASGGVLQAIGGSKTFIGPHYQFLKELTNRQKTGFIWLAEGLGPEFIYWLYSQHVFHIIGENTDGDTVAGTGIAIAPEWILTCRHVLADMSVNEEQCFGGVSVRVVEKHLSSSADVGLLRVTEPVPLVQGLSFSTPVISEELYAIGFPRIPLSRSAVPVMHRGEVIAPAITSLDGHSLFLYSAVSRPGNSGGPIVSEFGRVVGIVTKELHEQCRDAGLPFYAGVASDELRRAISELGVPIQLPIEDFS